jgi:hypothetical protein
MPFLLSPKLHHPLPLRLPNPQPSQLMMPKRRIDELLPREIHVKDIINTRNVLVFPVRAAAVGRMRRGEVEEASNEVSRVGIRP